MKVFVTGATGVIGSRAVRKLVEAGHQVTGVARSEPKAAGLRQLGATPGQVSLFDRAALTYAIRGHDAVANLATNVPPLDQVMNPQAWEMSNRIRTEGSVYLTRAAVEVGCQIFIQESITFPYADGGENWIDETAPIARPAEMASSGVAEEQAEWFTQAGGQGIVLRFALF
jgi:nucleoside-diphosphate-sugar epimerase